MDIPGRLFDLPSLPACPPTDRLINLPNCHPHGFVDSVKADNVLPAGTTSKPSPAASPEMTLPLFPEEMVPPAFAVQSCVPVAESSA